MVLGRAIRRDGPGNVAPRLQVRVDAAMRAGVSVVSDQHAAQRGQSQHHRSGEVRRAHAHAARQGRHRGGGAPLDRVEEPADEHRRRTHLVRRAEGASRTRRASWCAGRGPGRRGRRSWILVQAVSDPASALRGAATSEHALPRQGRRALEPRQQIRRTRVGRDQADLDPARPDQPRPHRSCRSRHGRRSQARLAGPDRGCAQPGD